MSCKCCNCLLMLLFGQLHTKSSSPKIFQSSWTGRDAGCQRQRATVDLPSLHEEFIGLYEPPRTTDSVIADCIKDVFIRLNLRLSMLRGQTYDMARVTCLENIVGVRPLLLKLTFFWATRFFILFFPYFFVSGPCAKLSWPSRQLLSAR